MSIHAIYNLIRRLCAKNNLCHVMNSPYAEEPLAWESPVYQATLTDMGGMLGFAAKISDFWGPEWLPNVFAKAGLERLKEESTRRSKFTRVKDYKRLENISNNGFVTTLKLTISTQKRKG